MKIHYVRRGKKESICGRLGLRGKTDKERKASTTNRSAKVTCSWCRRALDA